MKLPITDVASVLEDRVYNPLDTTPSLESLPPRNPTTSPNFRTPKKGHGTGDSLKGHCGPEIPYIRVNRRMDMKTLPFHIFVGGWLI